MTGAVGYFVADEGVKAALSASRAPTYNSASPAEQRAPLMGGAFPVGFDDVADFDVTAAEVQSALESVAARSQFELLDTALDSIENRSHWHDYSGASRGLLVDSMRGRLTVDLSKYGASEIPGIDKFSDLITETRRDTLSPGYPIRAVSLSRGELTDVIAPIIIQVGLQFSVHTISGTSRTLRKPPTFFLSKCSIRSVLRWWRNLCV
ncbi:MAG: hypothetical protein J6386_01020 [Candidatus Synoicihabitans palmerolidicus]|nr:hypothetical protein [Candidatus Synoicihabitans palmerolidicus]